MAAYGVDTLDPAVTPRRVAVLAKRLPPWARSPGDPWSTEAHLLANLIDHVAMLTYVTAKAAGAKNLPRPKPVPRPRQGGAAAAPRARRDEGGGQAAGIKASSWLAAAEMLTGIAGVEVTG